MAKRRKSDLPFGSQFSPSQIDLSKVLDIAQEFGGTTADFTERIRAEFFSRHAGGDVHQQKEIAKNIRLSLREYHVVGEDERFTNFGQQLYDLKHDAAKLFDQLARHI